MSRRTQCVSNVAKLTAAWLAYTSDNDSHLCNFGGVPDWFHGLSQEQVSSAGRLAVVAYFDPITTIPNGQLWPYLKDFKLYVCPDDPQQVQWIMGRGPSSPGGMGRSYGMNLLLGGTGSPYASRLPFTRWEKPPYSAYHAYTLRNIANPSQTFMFMEDFNALGAEGLGCPIYPNLMKTSIPLGRLHVTASGAAAGCTVSFADGHAIFWNYAVTDARPDAFDPPSRFDTQFLQGTGPDVLQLAAWSGGPVPPPQ
jgi:hypothetical protein